MATVKPLIVIVGETASGKTDIGIKLAQKFNGEIICADSRTVYKGMDIGTAKPSLQERQGVPHHLLDVIRPNQPYNASKFQHDALQLIDEISARGKLPIIVGGTGLYVDSVVFNYDFDHKTMSDVRPNTLIIGVQRERHDLQHRIERRVDVMIKNGLVQEVKQLGSQYGWNSAAMSGIGYKQFGAYVRGDVSIDEARAQTIRETKLFAKRQRTWFKRNKSIHWENDLSKIVDLTTTFLSNIN